MSNQVWICGQYHSGEGEGVVWSFQGVFSDEKKAVAACVSYQYFIAPALMDKEFPDKIRGWKGAYYPHLQPVPPPTPPPNRTFKWYGETKESKQATADWRAGLDK